MTEAAPLPTEFPDAEAALDDVATFAMARVNLPIAGEVRFTVDAEGDRIDVSVRVAFSVPGREGGFIHGATIGVTPVLGDGLRVWGDLLGTALGVEVAEADFAAAVERIAAEVVACARRCVAEIPEGGIVDPPETPFEIRRWSGLGAESATR